MGTWYARPPSEQAGDGLSPTPGTEAVPGFSHNPERAIATFDAMLQHPRMPVMPLDLSDLIAIVDEPRAVEDLRNYFAAPPTGRAFSGRLFQSLGGGGDRGDLRDMITTADLVAVQMLSVVIPRDVAVDLLVGPLGCAVAAELERIPTDVDLGTDATLPLIADDGPADRAWHLLEGPTGTGWVIAGKLLARKRPRLVPVYDGVVRCAVGKPPHAWTWFHRMFTERVGALPRRLGTVRAEAGVSEAVAAPRVLDVILWMRHRDSHRPSRCPRAEFQHLEQDPHVRDNSQS